MTSPLPFGYCLVRQGTADLPPACPLSYIGIAGCLCPAAIPFPDNIPLYGTDFRPEPLAAKWGITPETATALFRFNEVRLLQIDYASLTYCSLETARLARSTFFPNRPDVLLIALGAVDDAFLRYPGIQHVSPFPPDARLLGFDLYEFGDSVPEGAPLPPLDFPSISTMGLGCPLFCSTPTPKSPPASASPSTPSASTPTPPPPSPPPPSSTATTSPNPPATSPSPSTSADAHRF